MIASGARLGPYEVLSVLGAGGMGEVYRARDTRLAREVAIKVLPPAFAADPERLQRFEQEARAAAALNHPNILAVHDIGQHPSAGSEQAAPFIVSELLEGETLRERLHGGPLPVRKAIEYGVQIAQGLAAAHERGIAHRDLKPENIFVTTDGRIKILDFGLAKLTQPEPAMAGMSVLPTAAPDTLPGMVLGTVGYMAPEQVRGHAADHRSDIFALGTILYEMLAGQRAFQGDTAIDMMTAILKEDPPDLPTGARHIPPALERIIDRCLEKNPGARFQSTGDLAFALAALSSVDSSAPLPAVHDRASVFANTRVAWSAAAVFLIVSIASLAVGAGVFRAPPPTEPNVRFQIPSPGPAAAEMFTLSPDGRYLAFISNSGGADQVWIRPMDTLEPRALPGTDGASYPFWSPDGSHLGFFSQAKLKKIAIVGGPPQTLCDATDGRGGTWNRDGVILFSAGATTPIFRVSDSGGIASPVTVLAPGGSDAGHRFPVFLPDGGRFLYTVGSDTPDTTGLYVGTLDGAAPRRILPDPSNALFVPPVPPARSGHLLFRREETLMAQPFDPNGDGNVEGMFPIAEQVPVTRNNGFGAFSVSENGVLAYRTGGSALNRELVWVDRAGKRLRAVTKPGAFSALVPAISPDQRTVAVQMISGAQRDIWLQDMERDVISRFTFRPGINRNPVWSPDGSRLVSSLQGLGTYSSDIYQKSVRGNGQEELLLHAGVNGFPLDWSPDGKWIVYQQTGGNTAIDLWLLPLEGDRKPVSYLQTQFNEGNARFAPAQAGASRWIAYQSDESGQNQIYVQAIPASGAKYQISTSGGTQPAWRRDGKELFYLSTDQKLMAVPIALGAGVEPGTPRELFDAAGPNTLVPSPDGQRFLMNVPAAGQRGAAPAITVVLNWVPGLTK